MHSPVTWNPLHIAVCFNFTGTFFPEQSQSQGDSLLPPLTRRNPLSVESCCEGQKSQAKSWRLRAGGLTLQGPTGSSRISEIKGAGHVTQVQCIFMHAHTHTQEKQLMAQSSWVNTWYPQPVLPSLSHTQIHVWGKVLHARVQTNHTEASFQFPLRASLQRKHD